MYFQCATIPSLTIPSFSRHSSYPVAAGLLQLASHRRSCFNHSTILQRVQNTAARLVLGLDRHSHITPALRQLHWLPVRFRIIFKVAVTMHNVFHQRCPSYLTSLISFTAADPGRSRLRSSTRAAITVRTRTSLGRRAFSVSGPSH